MNDLITLKCPSCGGNLEIRENTSVLKCHHCGTEHLVRRETGSVILESYAQCPKCRRNDKVEKISSLLRKENKDSGLAISLSPPALPENLPKPDLKPKPELPPKPEPLPQPKPISKHTLPEKPSLYLIKPKKTLLIIGSILLAIGYFFLSSSVGFFIDELKFSGTLLLLFLASTPILLGIFLLYKGFSAKNEFTYESADLIGSEDKLNLGKKTSNKPMKVMIITSIITTVCLVLSLVIYLNESVGGLIFALSFSFLPLLIGLFILLRNIFQNKIYEHNQKKLQGYEQVIHQWETSNNNIYNKWEQENEDNIEEWRKDNLALEQEWGKKNNNLIKAWEEENAKITEVWEEENVSSLKDWKSAMERWKKLYFCHRDDILFVPGEGTYSTVEDLNDYLHK